MANKEQMRLRESLLTHDRLRQVLGYDPESGIFLWKERISIRIVVGRIAGRHDRNGHRQITIDGTRWMAHRLAWFYVHGEWPEDEIDHIDGEKDNNRISNLRNANRSQNMKNVKKLKTNTSGYKGVTFHSYAADGSPRWMAQIQVDSKHHYLGLFVDPNAAHAAYVLASREKHGEFGRVE